MNSDLNVLVLLYLQGELLRVAISIKNGLNNFEGWEYFKEPEIKEKWEQVLPLHLAGSEILEVTQIFDVITGSIYEKSFSSKELGEFVQAPKQWQVATDNNFTNIVYDSVKADDDTNKTTNPDIFNNVAEVLEYMKAGGEIYITLAKITKKVVMRDDLSIAYYILIGNPMLFSNLGIFIHWVSDEFFPYHPDNKDKVFLSCITKSHVR